MKMNEREAFIFTGVLVVSLFTAVAVVLVQSSRRFHALVSLAKQRGWRFGARVEEGVVQAISMLGVETQGNASPAIGYTLGGEFLGDDAACAWLAGDCSARYKGMMRGGTGEFSFALVRLPYRGMPNVRIRPEIETDSITQALFGEDVNFESEKFSRNFQVTSNDPRFAHGLITPKMMEAILASGFPTLYFGDRWILLTDGMTRWDAEDFEHWITLLERLVPLVPRHLVVQLSEED